MAWMKPNEAADYIGFSIASLQAWRCKGKGPRYIKLNGRSVRYEQTDLDQWMKSSGLVRPTDFDKARVIMPRPTFIEN